MQSVPPDTLRVALQTEDRVLHASIARALAPERIRAREAEAYEAMESPGARPDALVVDAALDVPTVLASARREGWLGRSTPVFVVMETPLPRDRQLDWLREGVWEFVRLPLDGEVFALRVRNLLRARNADDRATAAEPYAWSALVRVAEESMALARRFRRPFSVVAISLDWGDRRADDTARDVLHRLAHAAGERIRRSDLLGLSPGGTLLILLPDSDEAGGEIFLGRMEGYLADQLREWNVAARLRTGLTGLDHGEDVPAEGLLEAAETGLG